MKHTKTKFSFLLTLVLINVAVSTEIRHQKLEEAKETACADACSECQRAVYQLKFHGMADCDANRACRGTCFKVRELWGAPFNPFEPFVKDTFGKCEICFRAGHCSISQCKDQERNELEVINRVLNSAHLTSKVDPQLLNSYKAQIDIQAEKIIAKTNLKVEKILNKELKTAVSLGTTELIVPQVQNLVTTYFDNSLTPVKVPAKIILNGDKPQQGLNNKGSLLIKKSQKAVEKIGKGVAEIKELKAKASKENNKKVQKVIKKEEKKLTKLIGRINKLENKIAKKVSVLTNYANSQKDEASKQAVNNSLKEVKEYSKVVKDLKDKLKEDKKKLN